LLGRILNIINSIFYKKKVAQAGKVNVEFRHHLSYPLSYSDLIISKLENLSTLQNPDGKFSILSLNRRISCFFRVDSERQVLWICDSDFPMSSIGGLSLKSQVKLLGRKNASASWFWTA